MNAEFNLLHENVISSPKIPIERHQFLFQPKISTFHFSFFMFKVKFFLFASRKVVVNRLRVLVRWKNKIDDRKENEDVGDATGDAENNLGTKDEPVRKN